MRYSSEDGEGEKTVLQWGGEEDLAPDCCGGFIHALKRDSQRAVDALPHKRQKNHIF